MGIAFTDVGPEHQRVLDAWLEELANPAELHHDGKSAFVKQEVASVADHALERLIRLLAARGVLSEADAYELLGPAMN
jgi:hypothetical protein